MCLGPRIPAAKAAPLLLLCVSVFLSPALALQARDTPDFCTADPGKDCSIDGNSDFYGLGVRLGIYFAWLTSWLANNFLPEEISGALDTNSIFLLALSVVVYRYTKLDELRAIDALVLLQLSFGFLFSVMSLWGYRTMYYREYGASGQSHFGGVGTHCRLLLATGISAYAVYFWFRGLGDGLPQCDRRLECGGLQTFLFAKVPLNGGIRTFYKIASVVCSVYFGVSLIVAVAAGSVRFTRWMKMKFQREWRASPEELVKGELWTRRGFTKVNVLLSAFNFCWMLYTGLMVEFTLNFNKVYNVLGDSGISLPGQQIPLLIGAGSLLRIGWLIFREYYSERKKKQIPSAEKGLGLDSTPSTAAPQTPVAAASRQQWGLTKRVLAAWLPWLNTFESFTAHDHTFTLISSERTTPAFPLPREMEMYRTSMTSPKTEGSIEQQEAVAESDTDIRPKVDTEYHGHPLSP